jgi:hypothetical protein
MHWRAPDPDHEAEFREAITRVIPSVSELPKDKDQFVRMLAAELIGKLANHGERAAGKRYGTADQRYEVEFLEAVASMIPSFTKLLEDEEEVIRFKTITLIGQLANHGERESKGIAVKLTWTIKLSFVKPS